MKRTLRHIVKNNLPLIFILLLAFFFRFYNLTNWFSFGMDQEYEALLIKNIVSLKHIPLIGVNISDTGLYLGPFFLYLGSIPFIIFGGNPLGWAITASLLGVITTYFIYKITEEIYGKRPAIFASFFYAASFLTSFYDRHFWNPTLIPLISLGLVYSLYKIAKGKSKFLLLTATLFGLGFHSHLSILVFLPIIIFFLIKFWSKINTKILVWSLIIFLFFLSPLILFDLRHNFTNSRAVIDLLTGKNQNQTVLSNIGERLSLFTNTLGRFVWLPVFPDLFVETGQCRELNFLQKKPYPEMIILALLSLVVFTFSCCHFNSKFPKKIKIPNLFDRIIMAAIIMAIISVLFYQKDYYEYYLLFLLPLFAIILAKSVNFLWNGPEGRLIVYFILILFLILNSATLLTAKSSYSFADKLETLSFSKKYLTSENYSLEALGECPRFGGYRYLYEHFVSRPLSSYMDSYFSWIYQDKKTFEKPGKIVLLSLIDTRLSDGLVVKWQEAKLRFLTDYNILAIKRIGKIHLYLLSPKS